MASASLSQILHQFSPFAPQLHPGTQNVPSVFNILQSSPEVHLQGPAHTNLVIKSATERKKASLDTL